MLYQMEWVFHLQMLLILVFVLELVSCIGTTTGANSPLHEFFHNPFHIAWLILQEIHVSLLLISLESPTVGHNCNVRNPSWSAWIMYFVTLFNASLTDTPRSQLSLRDTVISPVLCLFSPAHRCRLLMQQHNESTERITLGLNVRAHCTLIPSKAF